MCGRYAFFTPLEAVTRLFGVSAVRAEGLEPRYNIAPTQEVPIVRITPLPGEEMSGESARELALARWGLVPFWAKDPTIANRMINARGETVAHKPAFRAAFGKRRCLLPADGFFEWQRTASGKQPWYIRAAGGASPLALAGLWERWDPPAGGAPLVSCTIITTRANEFMRPLHDRMPVLLDSSARDAWLDAAARPAALQDLLVPAPETALEAWPVSREVNSPAHEGVALISPLPARNAGPGNP